MLYRMTQCSVTSGPKLGVKVIFLIKTWKKKKKKQSCGRCSSSTTAAEQLHQFSRKDTPSAEGADVCLSSLSRHAENTLCLLPVCVDELSGSFSEIAAVTFGLLDLSPICTEDLRSSSLMEATELWRTFSNRSICSLRRTCDAFSNLTYHSWTQSWCRNRSKTDRFSV